ncbi:hypothetical protein DRA14_24880 [Salmonella enterica subsp. enterica]|nr:hypothetical protein [Salmonella enterica subsp. enterica]
MVCVVGRMRDLILQLSKSSIYSTKPDKKINKTIRSEYDLHHFPRLFSLPYCPACFSWSAICSFTFCVRTPLSGIFWLFIRSS